MKEILIQRTTKIKVNSFDDQMFLPTLIHEIKKEMEDYKI